MTADTLLLEYSDWVAANNTQHGSAALARYVVDVVIPHERAAAEERGVCMGLTQASMREAGLVPAVPHSYHCGCLDCLRIERSGG
jgi:hypothetical protein